MIEFADDHSCTSLLPCGSVIHHCCFMAVHFDKTYANCFIVQMAEIPQMEVEFFV